MLIESENGGAGTRGATGVDAFDLLARWQRFLAVSGRCGEDTRRAYARAAGWCLQELFTRRDWTRAHDPFLIAERDLVDYLDGIDPRGGYRDVVVKALRSLFAYAAEDDLAPPGWRSPVRNLRARPPKVSPAPSLDRKEVRRLLRSAELVDPRARWAIQLQYVTACRVGSLIELMPEDVHRGRNAVWIHFREAKNDSPYEQRLGPRGIEAVANLLELIEYVPARGRRRPTLVGVGYERYRQWLKEAADRAGLRAWTHLLRHSQLTHIAEDPSIDVNTIKTIAHWKTLSEWPRYVARSDRQVAKAMRRHG